MLKFPFNGWAKKDSQSPDADNRCFDEDIEDFFDEVEKNEMEEEPQPTKEMIDHFLNKIPEQAKEFIIKEKMIKLKTGELLLAQILFTRQNMPVINHHASVKFINLISPVVIKTVYIPNVQRGTMITHHVFEEWISNTRDPSFPMDIADIQALATPMEDVINNYKIFTTKSRMYKLNPTLAAHIFESPFMDIPENYNVEMAEIADVGFEDTGPNETTPY